MVDATGDVVLVGSQRRVTMLFRMRIEETGLRFTWFRLLHGGMWDHPVATDAGILVPVERFGQVDVRRIEPTQFHNPRPCWSL